MNQPSPMERYFPRLTERGRRWVRFFALLAAAALLIWIAVVLRRILTPIVAALALAYVLNPLVTWLEVNRKISRVASIGIGLGLLALAGTTLAIAGTVQVLQLAGDVPDYAQRGVQWLDDTVPGLFTSGEPAAATQPSSAATPTPDGGRERLAKLASEHGLTVGRTLIGYLARIVSDAFYWLSLTVLLPLYTFFFLLRFNEFVRMVHDHLPADYRPTIVRVVTTIDEAISSFFRGRLLVCLAVGTLTGVGWLCLGWFGVRVPYNLALGALAGVLNLIPFMSVLSLPPALLLTYLDASAADENWVIAVTLVAGVYVVVQGIESFVLNPTIQAKASGLHAVTTVIALLIGGQLAGLLGMLLAIPIASTLKSLTKEYVMPEIRRVAELREAAAAEAAGAGAAEPDSQAAKSDADGSAPETDDASDQDVT